jgi:hypothetical protein
MRTRTRKLKRCSLDTYIDFPDYPRRFDWKVTNLSPSGCQVTGSLPLRLNQSIRCVLTVPGCAIDADIDSRVVWMTDRTFGLEFKNLPSGMRLRLAMALYGAKKAA